MTQPRPLPRPTPFRVKGVEITKRRFGYDWQLRTSHAFLGGVGGWSWTRARAIRAADKLARKLERRYAEEEKTEFVKL